jgi:hypothetical protein
MAFDIFSTFVLQNLYDQGHPNGTTATIAIPAQPGATI